MAGLLDGLFSGGGGGGGLLDFLRENAMNQQMQSGLSSDQAQYGQPMQAQMSPQSNYGLNQPSQFDNAQWPAGPIGAPSQSMAQAPAAPGQPPMQAAPAQQPIPGGQPQGAGGNLMAGLANLNSGGNPITMLANVVNGFSTGQRHDRTGIALQQQALVQQRENQTAKYLETAFGIDPAMAASIASNPETLREVWKQKTVGNAGTVINNRLVEPRTGRVIGDFSDTKAPETKEFDTPNGKIAMQWDVASKKWVPVDGTQESTPSAFPPRPAGMDPKVWREGWSKSALDAALPGSSEVASKLRNEVQGLPSYKNLASAAPVYKSMMEAAGRDTRAADVNMIYGMAKIMDPGSVVRESEMTIAQAIATLPQQLQATVSSQLTSTGRLTPEVRAGIMQEAHSRIGAYQGMFDQDAGMYRGIVQRGRMNEADVLPTFGPFDQYRPQPKQNEPVVIDGYEIKAR